MTGGVSARAYDVRMLGKRETKLPAMSTQPQYRLRVARHRAGLTQRDLAFLFGITPTNYISKLEHGDRKVDLGFAIRYHVLLEEPLEWLFEDDYRLTTTELALQARQLVTVLRRRDQTRFVSQRIRFLERFIHDRSQEI